ncbi:MAG TPA: cytochrome c3 family protein [Planctomycetota bacterium]|nr:cytochrome c3 family protein [Planctomycetota bacterium]
MALLSGHGKGGKAALAAMLASAAGCMLLDRGAAPESRSPFSHRIHAEEGLDCSDCHGDAAEGEPRMPVLAQCQLCHEELDAEKPPEKQAATVLAARAAFADPWAGDDVIFAHPPHLAAELECGACHAGVGESESLRRGERLSMEACMDCHARLGAPNECATCHTTIRADEPPESHEHNWRRVHGQVARAGTDQRSDRCSLCHTETSCVSCHLDQPPENHTSFWRLRGHGVAAALDRQGCATCHRSDSCESCHEEVLPLSHSGMWGGTKSTHCLSCHFPLKAETCFVCHKDTPSHLLAPPKPPDHTPGMNCRQCHGNGAPLPHVDKGDNCNMCHL